MALLRADAERLSSDKLVSGVIEEIINRDAVYALLPFVGNDGAKTYSYVRENTLPDVNFVDVGEAIPEGAATFTDVHVKLKIMAHNIDVDNFLSGTMNNVNNQIAIQLQAGAKAIDEKFRRTMIVGNSATNAKEFDGLKTLVTAPQTLTAGANGASLTFDMLDELIHAVPNRPDALFMRYSTYRTLRSLMRNLSAVAPEHIKLKDFDRAVPAYDGLPIILSDYIPTGETQGTSNETTSIFAARMNTVDGVHGIYGDPTAGVVLENIGTREDYDANRYRLKWYVTMALKSTRSLAMLKGVLD